MKIVPNLFCRRSLLLALALLFSAGQGYSSGGQVTRLAVSSLSQAMPLPLDKSTHRSELMVGILSLAVGPMIMLAVSEAQEPLLTVMGGVLTACGVVMCAGKVLSGVIGLATRHTKASLLDLDNSIVIYDSGEVTSDGHPFKLGLIDGAGSNYSTTRNSPITVASADGVQHTIKARQIKRVLDLTDYYAKALDEQATVGVEQPLLSDLRHEPRKYLDNAVVVFEHGGKNYLETFSGIKHTDDGGVELIIVDSNRKYTVISIDSEGKPALDGEPLQAVLFLP